MARVEKLGKTGGDFCVFIEIWNELLGLEVPAIHRRMATWLNNCMEQDQREQLLMAFRGAGKSTLVGQFAAWLLYQNAGKRIMVLSADHALARRMVRNVRRIIERHPLCAPLRPGRDAEWAADRFTVIRDEEWREPSVLAQGILGNITGGRADVIICDDVEVPNTCNTPAKRADLRLRLDEMEYILTPGGVRLFIGTPHTTDSLYRKTPAISTDEDGAVETVFLSGFTRLEIPVLDEHGDSVWPERFSLERIAAIKKRSGPNRFQSQMMLESISHVDGHLDETLFKIYDAPLEYSESGKESILRIGERRLVSVSCWWDPAWGRVPECETRRNDNSVIAVVFIDEDGNYRLHAIDYVNQGRGKDSRDENTEAARQCGRVANFLQRYYIPSVCVESNGIGRFLPELLRSELGRLGIGASVQERFNRHNKAARIVSAFDAPLASGRLYAHADVMRSSLIDEIREWRPQGQSRGRVYDDGLDAVAGCLLEQPVRLPRYGVASNRPTWRTGKTPVRANSIFQP